LSAGPSAQSSKAEDPSKRSTIRNRGIMFGRSAVEFEQSGVKEH
jgi:hypothetical protein